MASREGHNTGVDFFLRPWEERARDTGEDAGVRDMGGAGEGHGRSAGEGHVGGAGEGHAFIQSRPPDTQGGLGSFLWEERARDTGEDAGVSDMGGAGEGHRTSGRWRSAGDGQHCLLGRAVIQSRPPMGGLDLVFHQGGRRASTAHTKYGANAWRLLVGRRRLKLERHGEQSV